MVCDNGLAQCGCFCLNTKSFIVKNVVEYKRVDMESIFDRSSIVNDKLELNSTRFCSLLLRIDL